MRTLLQTITLLQTENKTESPRPIDEAKAEEKEKQKNHRELFI